MTAPAFLKKLCPREIARSLAPPYARFPVPATIATLLTIQMLAAAHGIDLIPAGLRASDIVSSLVKVFFYTLGISMLAESAPLGRTTRDALLIGGASLLAVPTLLGQGHAVGDTMLFLALALFLACAPYIGRRVSEDSVWQFFYRSVTAAILCAIAAAILGIGLCAILASIQYLFKIGFRSAYVDVWVISWAFFFPVYFLTQLPPRYDFDATECTAPPAASFITRYLLVPFCLIYTAILYLYGAKILLQWELPRGTLAYMICGFGVAGIVTHMAVHPMRNAAGTLPHLFYRYFYATLIVPVGLLAIGVYTRIAQYGLTEERFALLIALVWLAALSLLNIACRARMHLKYVPMTLGALLLVFSFGPWSATSLSVASQTARLERLLHHTGIIKADGTIGQIDAGTSIADKKSIASAVEFLHSRSALARIVPWTAPLHVTPDEKDTAFKCRRYNCTLFSNTSYARRALEAWGIDYQERYRPQMDSVKPPPEQIRIHTDEWQVFEVQPYDYMVDINFVAASKDWTKTLPLKTSAGETSIAFLVTPQGEVTLVLPDDRKLTFTLHQLAADISAAKAAGRPYDTLEMLTLRKKQDGIDAMLRFSSLNIKDDNGQLSVPVGKATVWFSLR